MMVEKPVNRLLPIGYYVGLVIIGLGALHLIPVFTSLVYREWNILIDFIISFSILILIGALLALICGKSARSHKLGWGEGMTVTAISWIAGMILCAIPYYLSGQYLSFLDACFDVMSGFTTTGMVLIQNMDHTSNGINMWRHLLTFVGGQGMIVLALTFLVKGTNGSYKMYVGEGKDERLMPNVVTTARYIWGISLVYLLLGTVVLTIIGLIEGMQPDRALLHGMWLFMSSWSTGGFAPMSQNILYYHSVGIEIGTMIFFIIGSFNFALHYAVITGKRRELYKNIETMSMTVTVTVLTVLTMIGLIRQNVYADVFSIFRKVFYQLISGHTTTGTMTIYARQFHLEWGDLALMAMIIAMLIGGSACSTAGGFKGLRIGIIWNAFRREIRRLGQPESVVTTQRIHHIRDISLDDNTVRSAMLIVVAYMITFTLTTLTGLLCGYPLGDSAFEAASVTGNVGLSIGVTQASMPLALKLNYIITMWLARLEFMSILALLAYMTTKVKSLWKK
jgi:trk system potassium uptake protein TrkH